MKVVEVELFLQFGHDRLAFAGGCDEGAVDGTRWMSGYAAWRTVYRLRNGRIVVSR